MKLSEKVMRLFYYKKPLLQLLTQQRLKEKQLLVQEGLSQ
jgi:hypothetical protein